MKKINTQKSQLQQVSILRAHPSDLDKVFNILEKATAWLESRGMNHWNGVHTKERIEADFEKNHVLLAQDSRGAAVGTVTISFDAPWYHQPSDRMFWAQPEAFAACLLLKQLSARANRGILLQKCEAQSAIYMF